MSSFFRGTKKKLLVAVLREGVMQKTSLIDAFMENSPEQKREIQSRKEAEQFISKILEKTAPPLTKAKLQEIETVPVIQDLLKLLDDGVDWRESLVEAYGHFPKEDPTKQEMIRDWKQARNLSKKMKLYYGFSVENPMDKFMENSSSVDLRDLHKAPGNTFSEKLAYLEKEGKVFEVKKKKKLKA